MTPVATYRVTRDLPNDFFRKLFPGKFWFNVQAGETCSYFAHTDVYCFTARDGYVPAIDRKVVERWQGQYFEPVNKNKEDAT